MKLTLKDVVEFLKRYPIGVTCAGLSVIVLIGYYIRNNRAGELGPQLAEVETQAQKILGDVENSANLTEQFATLVKATKELDSRLVRSTERPRNQQYFYVLESETGVKEMSLQPTNAEVNKKAGDFSYGIGYSITVEGDYRQILDFVGRLESGQHFYRLVSATVSRHGEVNSLAAGSTISLALNIELLGLP
jgi:Tfp pilus assembly protein PilO